MNNAKWVNEKGYNFKDIMAIKGSSAGNPYVTIFIKGKPVETFKPNGLHTNDSYRLVLAWLDMEHGGRKEILTLAEREYLGAVIRPFRNRIKNIELWGKVAFSQGEVYDRYPMGNTAL